MIVKYDGQLVQHRCRWLWAMVNICVYNLHGYHVISFTGFGDRPVALLSRAKL